MKFKIDIKPLSVNEAWQGKRFKTKKYNNYQKECLLLMPNKKVKVKCPISIGLTFGFSNKLSDIDNPLKMILDILQKKYGFNDRDIYHLILEKKIVEKGFEYISVSIT